MNADEVENIFVAMTSILLASKTCTCFF